MNSKRKTGGGIDEFYLSIKTSGESRMFFILLSSWQASQSS